MNVQQRPGAAYALDGHTTYAVRSWRVAIELLAWDGFLGFALVFAALTFQPTGRERLVRRGFLVCGVLCLIGIAGPAVGNMCLQFVGVFAYGAILPGVCLLLTRLFRAVDEVEIAATHDSRDVD